MLDAPDVPPVVVPVHDKDGFGMVPVSVSASPAVLEERWRQGPEPLEEIPASSADLTDGTEPEVRLRLLVRSVFQFPWYRSSLSAWMKLSLGWLFLFVLVRVIFG